MRLRAKHLHILGPTNLSSLYRYATQGLFQDFDQGGAKRGVMGYWEGKAV